MIKIALVFIHKRREYKGPEKNPGLESFMHAGIDGIGRKKSKT